MMSSSGFRRSCSCTAAEAADVVAAVASGHTGRPVALAARQDALVLRSLAAEPRTAVAVGIAVIPVVPAAGRVAGPTRAGR